MGHGRPQGRRRAGVPQQTHFGRDSALATRSLCSLFTRSLDQARDSGPCASVAPSTRSYLATALGDTPGETTVIPDDLLFPEHASKWTLSHAGVTMPSAGAGHAPTLRGQAHGQASSWCGKALGLVCDSASAPGGAQAPEVRRSPCVTLREVRNINLHKMFYLIQRAARSHAHAASDETLSSSASSDSRVWHRAARRASPTKVLPGIVDWT
ncbi:uncharacterized protein LOC102155734 isoform X1 [Canis lupus familiaris]|uniref:uncharacterized protein LOC102155734 isoform X1 n=1 Tax=Canis lupus familiaris TaxID=9615 RepID=UPI0018F319EA|nr:uncharacterized protein LOC102155734 isoform X1 [Canis lupus familiaris]